jgi:hypothetical protein
MVLDFTPATVLAGVGVAHFALGATINGRDDISTCNRGTFW